MDYGPTRPQRSPASVHDLALATTFLGVLVVLIGVAALLYYGHAWLFAGEPGPPPPKAATPARPAPPPIILPTPVPTPTAPVLTPTPASPVPTPTAGPARQTARVGNTGGDGVYLRRTPRADDRLIAWPDNTPLVLLGEETVNEGRTWVRVRDPRGNVGWVPREYLVGP